MTINIKLLKDFRCFKAGETIQLPGPACLLVGDQGTGKSSLLHIIRTGIKDKYAEVQSDAGPTELRFFDTEKMNPRTKDHFSDDQNVIFEVAARFASHGQTMLPILMTQDLLNGKLSTFLIDEPESGLSLMSQVKVRDHYREMLKRGHHLVIATHSPVLMKTTEQVFDVAARKTVSVDEYLQAITGEN